MKLLTMRLMHDLYNAASNMRVRSCCGLCMDDTDIVEVGQSRACS